METQWDITRRELRTRLDDAIDAQNWPTAEHWLEQLRKLNDVECMLAAYAPQPS